MESTGEVFRDPIYLSQRILNSHSSALEYFYHSPFYQSSSLNEKLLKGISIEGEKEGILFEVISSNLHILQHSSLCPATSEMQKRHLFYNQHSIFVISKTQLQGPHKMALKCYYIVSGDIYVAPSLGSILRYRLYMAIRHLDKVVHRADSMTWFSLCDGYKWKADESAIRTQLETLQEKVKITTASKQTDDNSTALWNRQTIADNSESQTETPQAEPSIEAVETEGDDDDDDDNNAFFSATTLRYREARCYYYQPSSTVPQSDMEPKQRPPEVQPDSISADGAEVLYISSSDAIRLEYDKAACDFAVLDADLKECWEESKRIAADRERLEREMQAETQ